MDERTKKILQFFERIGDKITNIIFKPPTEKQNAAGTSFWNKKITRINTLTTLMAVRWAKYADIQLNATMLAESIKAGKLFKFRPVSKTFRPQASKILKDQTVLDMLSAIDGGKKDIKRYFRRTQQLNITEAKINESLRRGLVEGTPKATRDQLQKQLEKKLVNGKILTSSGRSYDPKAYAEMVSRTRLKEAQSEAVIQTVQNHPDGDLVQVSSHNTDDDICLLYEGRIFSISGTSKEYPKLTEKPPFHPNCLHSLTPAIITKPGGKRQQSINAEIEKNTKRSDKALDKLLKKPANTEKQKANKAFIESEKKRIARETNI